jgi:hypothetical protein
MKNNVLEAVLLIIGLIVLAAILLALPLQLLWNWLMPTLFNLPMITFWQALGLNIMSGILFKSNINIKKED